jgi:hypothetical protein
MRLCILTAVLAAVLAYPRDISAQKRVEAAAVEIRGNRDLSASAVLKGADIKKTGERISVDLASLDSVLAGNPAIGSYSVRMEEDRLVVEITESGSLLVAAVISGSSTILLEVDSTMEIVSKNNLRTPNLPIIYTEGGDLAGGEFSPGFLRIAESLNSLRKSESALYREIGEIRIIEGGIALKARRRGTLFVMGDTVKDFMKLKKVLGYMDRSERRYSLCDLRQEPAVLR